MKATCDRGAGDDADVEGSGCSAVDICAPGWAICEGDEVELRAGSGDDAVPPGTPDKALLFAVSQRSDDGTVCDDGASNGDDVCGRAAQGTPAAPTAPPSAARTKGGVLCCRG
jgi:hypothetical protein